MTRGIRGSDVFLAEDIRRILDSLQLARPDLQESIGLIRVALGLNGLRATSYSNDTSRLIDDEWRTAHHYIER